MAEVPGTAGYAQEAPNLLERYEKRPFADVHKHIRHLFPTAPAHVLDIGAGTGRDAAGFAGLSHAVTAVEPVREMREGAMRLHPEPNIAWIDDGLPELAIVRGLGQSFDFVMMNAVLMHLDDGTRARALETVATLMAPGGVLVLSLRHGPVPEGRTMFDIPATEIRALGTPLGLSVIFENEADSTEQAGISWTRMALKKT